MPRKLMSGNEAIALGAWEAGVKFAAGYPGTPSTEVLESIGRYPEVDAQWSTNEKVAFDEGMGAALADGSIGNSGIGEAAKAFLQQVGSEVAREDFGAACARMGHFVEFISGKSEKQIASDAAQVLLGLAQALMGEYGCGL